MSPSKRQDNNVRRELHPGGVLSGWAIAIDPRHRTCELPGGKQADQATF